MARAHNEKGIFLRVAGERAHDDLLPFFLTTCFVMLEKILTQAAAFTG